MADFYPRPPRGGRRADSAGSRNGGIFLSTPSARRATQKGRLLPVTERISIHALREEGDIGSRPRKITLAISIHALREEGDMQRCPPGGLPGDFYPRPPRGGRLG